MRRPGVSSPGPPPPPPAHDWAARATALQFESAAQWAILAAIGAAMAALGAWVVVVVPPGGDLRAKPTFWLMALPVMVWMWALQARKAWAVGTLWLALVLAPALVLAALLAAPALRQASMADGGLPGLDTPLAMRIILGVTILFSVAGAMVLRRSSLPGGTRPATFMTPGTLPPGTRVLPPAAAVMLMQGSLPLTGALVNGMFLAIIASVDPIWPGSLIWPAVVQTCAVLWIGTLILRGGLRLRRGAPDAARDLRRGWTFGMVWAAATIPPLWLWPTLLNAKLALSAFMVPIALAAIWCGRRALHALPGVLQATQAPAPPHRIT